jgi:hypothetical protein
MNYFRSVPLSLRSTSTCLPTAVVIETAVMVPGCLPLLLWRRNSMIPHLPAIAPGWQRLDQSASISRYFRFGTRHTQYDIVLEGKGKMITTKIVIPVYSSGCHGRAACSLFISMPPMSVIRLRQSPNSPRLQTCTPAYILLLSVSLNSPHYTRTTSQKIPTLT